MSDPRWTCDEAVDAYLATMQLPPKEFMDKLAAERKPIEAAAPKPGDPAPGFTAERLDRAGRRTGESVSLADFRGQNVALLFGNYTCPVYRGQIERFNEIFTELGDRLQFVNVYTREAHPEDGWQVEINREQACVYHQPVTLDERAAIARDCVARHGIGMLMLLDDMQDSVNKAYAGSPERLYLIDRQGFVRHRSPQGPFKLAVIDAWYAALKAQLAAETSAA